MSRRSMEELTFVWAMVVASGAAMAQEANVWGVDPLTKVMRAAAPPAAPEPVRIQAARGETASGQLAFRPTKDAKAVSAEVADLKNGEYALPATCVRLQWVRYIDVTSNSRGIPQDELVAKAPCSLPDPFWEMPAVDVPAGTVQPLWIEIDTPREAAPGEYTGTLKLKWEDGSASLPIQLAVWDFAMPAAGHQRVTQWFAFPGVGYQAAPDSPEYWDLAAKFAKIMAAHRQDCFLTELSRIKTTYDAQRGYVCDFSKLDQWAKIFFDAGMKRMELAWAGYSPVLGDQPGYHVSPADLVVEVKNAGLKLTPEQKLRGILEQLERHVRDKGWQGKVMIHVYDEPFVHGIPSYRQVAQIIHEAAPSLKIIEAVEATGFGDAIDVLVPKLNHLNLWWPYFQKARHDGKEVWFYTCCHPLGRYPNRLLDQPLVKTRVLHWIGYLYGLNGYLHWGLNQFAPGADPYSEAGIAQGLPPGDRAVMYPGRNGPVGSLRWSAMRDGLQDYEYLYVLQQRLTELKDRLGDRADWLDPRQRPLELCRRVVTSFYEHARKPEVLLETRRAVAGEIEALGQSPLLYVQTEPSEDTAIPAGPRWIIVRGVTEPGAAVKISGAIVSGPDPDGVFAAACPLGQPTVTIEATKDAKSRTITRSFRFVE